MSAQDNGLVILLAGLWMPGAVMRPLARRLHGSGFATRIFGYDSMRSELTANARRLAHFVAAQPAASLDLVGHSLGAVLIMRMLEVAPDARIRRAVLLAPPYRDSYAGRVLGRHAPGRVLLGRGVPEWLAGARGHAGSGASGVQIGVVAGTRRFGLGSLVIAGMPRPNDGVVTVEETRVHGMRDHIVLPVTHSGMLFSAAVARRVCEFLRDGAFTRAPG